MNSERASSVTGDSGVSLPAPLHSSVRVDAPFTLSGTIAVPSAVSDTYLET